jgi:hypothetical protein
MALSVHRPGTYVARYVYQLSANVRLKDFRSAWEVTVSAHTILRTRIAEVHPGGMFQVLLRDGSAGVGLEEVPDTVSVKAYVDMDIRKGYMGLGTPLI